MAPGNDSNSDRANSERTAANHCVNKFANNVWYVLSYSLSLGAEFRARFIQIMYFFDDPNEKERGKPRKMLHGQWFLHGSSLLCTLILALTYVRQGAGPSIRKLRIRKNFFS